MDVSFEGHIVLRLEPRGTMKYAPAPLANNRRLRGPRRGALGWFVTAAKVAGAVWHSGLLGGHQMVRRKMGRPTEEA